MKKISFILILQIIVINQNYAQNYDSIKINKTSRTSIVAYEAGIGALTTAGTLLGSALLLSIGSESNNMGEGIFRGIIAISASLTFGGALGVHLIDKKYNNNSSYWKALSGSVIGFGFGIGLLYAFSPGSYEAALIFLSPLTFSILSVNLINYEEFSDKISVNYQPIKMYDSISHNIVLKINF